MLTPNQLLHGTDEPLAASLPLRAGPLTLLYQEGDLRYLKLGEREVVRRIYAAVRDRQWGTVPGHISELAIERGEDSFRVTYLCEHRELEIHFLWRGEILGHADGTVAFHFDGEAKSTFLRNRIGFCVLHPIGECAGAPCRARYHNGTAKELAFPSVIAAEQPIRWLHDLAGLAHEVAPGLWAELTFEGDAFEMEDQRNWIDASFKTFCTPLRLPYPLEIAAGTRVRQTVTLRFVGHEKGRSQPAPASREEPVIVTAHETKHPLPAIGLGVASHGQGLTEAEAARLRALKLAHLRVDLRLWESGWRAALAAAQAEAKILHASLEIALHLPSDLRCPWTDLRQALAAGSPIARVLVFHQGQKSTTAAALAMTREHLPSLPLGAGTDADLYQLNLQRPPTEADFICWSMNPQVHAFDNASLAETPEAAAQQVASVGEYSPGRVRVVSPITLRPRFNPNATGPEPPTPAGQLPRQVDPRQMSLFGAVWTLAMIKQLAEAGADSLTFFETTGWRGVMEREESILPDQFPSFPGAVFPLYHVFAELAEFIGGQIIGSSTSNGLAIQSLLLEQGPLRALLLANLQPRTISVIVRGAGEFFTLRRLNQATAAEAMTQPTAWRGQWLPVREETFSLAPYEILCLRNQLQ